MTGPGLALRVVGALLVAGAGIFALDRAVRSGESHAELPAADASPEEPVPPPLPPLGRAREVLLMARGMSVPGGVWQVAEVLPDGEVRLRRPAPLAQGPEIRPTPTAALFLPVRSLGELSPVQRGALVDALSELAGGVPLEAARVRGRGVTWRPEELEVLLVWQR